MIANQFPSRAPNGRQFFVGAATLDNINYAEQIFKHDAQGTLRLYRTLASAVTSVMQLTGLAVTADATADTFTVTSGAASGLNNGDKVYVAGTTAPTGSTAGVIYYVVGVVATAPTVFQISATRGGTALNISSTGTAVIIYPLQSTGDMIYIMPSHNENVSSSTALNITTAGVTIKGLGEDETRPTFYLDTATTTLITVSAPAVAWENCIFDGTGFDAIVTMFSVTASDVRFESCKFINANATNQATAVITTTARANRFKFINNFVFGTTDAGTATALIVVGGNEHVIKGNMFYGAYTTTLGAIQNVTTACLRILVEDNVINNQTASSAVAMTFVSTSTGSIRKNHMQVLTGTAPIVGAAMSWVGANYYAATIATAGTLI